MQYVGSLLYGSPEDLDAVILQMREGPEKVNVKGIQVTRITHVPRVGFRIRGSRPTNQ